MAITLTFSDALAYRARETAIGIGERILSELALPDRYDVNFERHATKRLNGTVGYALFFLALAHATGEARFEAAMHAQLKRAILAPKDSNGLYDGLSGLRAVTALAAEIEPRYAKITAQCDEVLDAAESRLVPQTYMDYDLLTGWAGQRIARCIDGPRGLDRTANTLIALLENDRWVTPHPWRPEERGEHCLGMAHGLPGVLAALSITVDDLAPSVRELVQAQASYLVAQARAREGVLEWPRIAEDPEDEECRAVWCFGAPGVASALLQVALRCEDEKLKQFSTDALAQACSQSSEAMRVAEQGLCHGSMGNALVYYAASRRTGDARMLAACERFTLETLDALDRSAGHCVTRGSNTEFYDAIGHVSGVSGIGLALLTVAQAYGPRWLWLHALDAGI